MKVYHGSYTKIDEIDLSKCETGKDFGQGFYVTGIRSQAEYWAKRKGRQMRTKGFVTEYDFNPNIFRMMKMKHLYFDGYNNEWMDFVVLNRLNTSEQQAHDYDAIEGPVANDDIAVRIYAYIRGDVTKEQFLKELTHKAPSNQICFCSIQSLQALNPIFENKSDIAIIHIDSNVPQALIADFGMSETRATDVYYKSNTYTSLADESTELYKESWQEIYKMLKTEFDNSK